MAEKHRSRTPIEHTDEHELLTRAAGTDPDATRELYRRCAPGAWGLAVAITGTAEAAAAAVREGFVTAMGAVRDGTLTADDAFRPHMLGATRRAALESGDHLAEHVDELVGGHPDGSPVPATSRAFAELPEEWRAALWLNDIVMLPDGQVATALGEPEGTTEAISKRARTVLHEGLQTALAAGVADPDCALVTNQLSDLLAGKLDELAEAAVQEHFSGCDACRARREQVVSTTDHLAAVVPPLPGELEKASVNAWREAVGLPLITTGRTPAVQVDSREPSGEHAAIGVAADPFDAPEPLSERWKRVLAAPGPLAQSGRRRVAVAAAAAALVLVGGIGAAAHNGASHQVESALTADGAPEGSLYTGTPATLPDLTPPTTLPPLAGGPAGAPDNAGGVSAISDVAALTSGPAQVQATPRHGATGSPAPQGPAPSGTTAAPSPPTSPPGTAAPPPPSTAPPPPSSAPPPSSTPPPPTTTRHCVQWLLGLPNGLCLKWSS